MDFSIKTSSTDQQSAYSTAVKGRSLVFKKVLLRKAQISKKTSLPVFSVSEQTPAVKVIELEAQDV